MAKRLIIVILLGALAGLAFHRIYTRPVPQLVATGADSLRGAFHVHSEASHDSALGLEEIAAAAKIRDLDFVIVTDHDAQAAGPIRIDDVTLLFSAELTTPFGHVVQLGAGRRLSQEARQGLSLHESIRDLGGVPILAHPADLKQPWEGPIAGAGGIEVANFEASARRRAGPAFIGLFPALVVWRLRPDLAFAQIYDRDDVALLRWDREHDPRFVGLCGGDTHGQIDVGKNLAAWQVVLESELPEATDARATAIVEHLSQGRFHCVAGGFTRGARMRFWGQRTDGSEVGPGETVDTDAIAALSVESPAVDPDTSPEEPIIVLMKNGHQVVRTRGSELRYTHPGPGTYRVEIRLRVPSVLFGSRIIPAIYSNRIRVRAPRPEPATSVEGSSETRPEPRRSP